jgi:3-oxoacyl-[acyl-carrier-protein] synthase-1
MAVTAVRTGLDAAHWDGRARPAVVIAEATAWNALGTSTHQTWAFRRADVTSLVESPFRLSSGRRAILASIRTLPPRATGLDRLAPVIDAILAPHLARLQALGSGARVGAVLALAERFAEGAPPDRGAERQRAVALVERALSQAGLAPLMQVVTQGRAGGAAALLEAGAALASGSLDAVLVGGMDTHHDPDVLEALELEGRLFDGERPGGLVPGEGAAFLLCTRRDVARRAGWPLRLCVEGASFCEEPAARDPSAPRLAQGLTRALRAHADLLEAAGRDVDWWMCDLTHEAERVHEWQLAFPRACVGVSRGAPALDVLPPLLGDLGAATVPTALGIAAEGLSRGDPSGSTCLVAVSSRGAARGAVLATRA